MTDNLNTQHRSPGLKGKLQPNTGDIRSIWPKIVEYTGLSEYESKVYLSLLSLGNSGARKLSLHCDVPRTKVYGTLKKLIDYGLVVEIPGSPKQFAPSHPNEAFDTVLSLTKKKALDFDAVVRTLIKTHEKNKEGHRPPEEAHLVPRRERRRQGQVQRDHPAVPRGTHHTHKRGRPPRAPHAARIRVGAPRLKPLQHPASHR